MFDKDSSCHQAIFSLSYLTESGADLGGYWGDFSPKTYERNCISHDFAQLEKQH